MDLIWTLKGATFWQTKPDGSDQPKVHHLKKNKVSVISQDQQQFAWKLGSSIKFSIFKHIYTLKLKRYKMSVY